MFVVWCLARIVWLEHRGAHDEIFIRFFDIKGIEGAPPDDGSKRIADLLFFLILNSCHCEVIFLRAALALRSLRRRGPARQRPLLSLVLLAAIVAKPLSKGKTAESDVLLLQHLTYMRPGEVCSTRAWSWTRTHGWGPSSTCSSPAAPRPQPFGPSGRSTWLTASGARQTRQGLLC